MSAQHRMRSMIVALFGALVLALGSVALHAPTAAAAPNTPTPVMATDGEFPFGSQGTDNETSTDYSSKKDKRADKAEKLGGNVITEVIDLVTGVIKCGLNIASESVKCSL